VNGIGPWTTLLGAVEALAIVGEPSRSAATYDLIIQAIEGGALFRQWDLRSLHTLAGIAARCDERWEPSERHFRIAIEQAERLPVRLEAAEARRFYAEMLVARRSPGDASTAGRLVDEAAGVYERAGMRAHLQLTRSLLDV